MEFTYKMPVKVIMGKGCIRKNPSLFSIGKKKALIVTGRSSAKKNGALDDVCGALSEINIKWHLFDKVEPNPSVENVRAGAGAAIDCGADFVIGIGGGSPMDAAKAVAMLSANGNRCENIFKNDFQNPPLPVIAVPTTAGTGSEVTQYSIITVPEEKTKKNLFAPSLFPTIAFLDATYTEKLPHNITVNTAIDAYSHAVESYLSVRSTEMSSVSALESVRILGECFDALSGDAPLNGTVREKLLYASMLAGISIAQTGTTAVHAMGYSLTCSNNIDHGKANGLLLSAFLDYVRPDNQEKVDRIIKLSGFSGPDEISEWFTRLFGKQKLLSDEEIAAYARMAEPSLSVTNTNPRPSYEDICSIYKKSIGT